MNFDSLDRDAAAVYACIAELDFSAATALHALIRDTRLTSERASRLDRGTPTGKPAFLRA